MAARSLAYEQALVFGLCAALWLFALARERVYERRVGGFAHRFCLAASSLACMYLWLRRSRPGPNTRACSQATRSQSQSVLWSCSFKIYYKKAEGIVHATG